MVSEVQELILYHKYFQILVIASTGAPSHSISDAAWNDGWKNGKVENYKKEKRVNVPALNLHK